MDSTKGLRTEATAVKAARQPAGEGGAIVVHCTGAADLAPGERCGLTTHTSAAESPPCWVGCSAKPSGMDAGAVLSEGSTRQEAPTDAKCGVGCKICVLAPGVRKSREVRGARDGSHIPSLGACLCCKHTGQEVQLPVGAGQSEDILATRLAQHNLSQPLPKA